jgi:hypothetical protein
MPASVMTLDGSAARPPGRSRALVLLLAGVALSVAAFLLARQAHRREVEGQFRAAAQDHAETVGLGLDGLRDRAPAA